MAGRPNGDFTQAQKNIDWALTCLGAGREAFGSYVKTDAFAFVVEHDPDTGDRLYKCKLISRVPNEVEGYFRTALVELKHSFDMSLFTAAQAFGCPRFDKPFPWADSELGFEAILRGRQRIGPNPIA